MLELPVKAKKVDTKTINAPVLAWQYDALADEALKEDRSLASMLRIILGERYRDLAIQRGEDPDIPERSK